MAFLVAVLLLCVALLWPLGSGRLKRVSRPVLYRCLGWFAAVGGLLWLTFAALHLDLERHGPVLWTWVAVGAGLGGVLAAAKKRAMPNAELYLALIASIAGAAVLAFVYAGDEGLASPPWRALLVAPAVLGLCSYFGASLGYLVWGAGVVDRHLGYESLVGRRFLLSKSSPVLSTVTTISVIGVALGVWLVLVSLGILGGFEADLQRKIIGVNAHAVIEQNSKEPFALAPAVMDAIGGSSGVLGAAGYIEGEVAVASYSNYTGAMMFGVEPKSAAQVLSVLEGLPVAMREALQGEETAPPAPPPGDGDEFPPPAPMPNIVIGSEMAKSLNVKEGDRVRVISPSLEVLTPVGVAPKSLGFRVAGIFTTKMYEFDARFAYISLAAARRFFELGDHDVSGVFVRTRDPERAYETAHAALQASGLGERYTTLDWKRRNQTLFSALKLERVVAFVVLVFIILVASFSIVNTLTMSVIEKRREIAILKTMGARDVGIMKLFLVQGLVVGGFGIAIGAVAGVVTMTFLQRFGFQIPGDVYYIDSLPVELDPRDVVLVTLAAILIVWDFAVFPALMGSRLQPVEGLRDG